MESIKITDKLTLRQEALRLSVATGTNHPISQAQQFEAYLSNDLDLPEYEDTHKDFKDMLGKFQESFAQPRSMWISADDEMKPAEDVEVLGASKDEKGNIYYQMKKYSPRLNEWIVAGYDECDPGEVVAWMPIPEYRPTR